jgi:hypothetical protein
MTGAQRIRTWAWFAMATLASAAIAYWRSFSRMVPYDDEGTMMLGLDRLFRGQPLYDSVRSIYGPFYYLYETVAHRLAGSPVSHDVVRWASVAWWVTAGLLLFWLVYRATGSLAVALVAQYAGFRDLSFIGLETAHPQEACITLLLAIAMAAAWPRGGAWRWLVLGALAGAIALSKINLAIFVIAGLALVFALGVPAGAFGTVLRASGCVAALALGPMLMRGTFGHGGGAERFAALVAFSGAASLAACAGYRMERPLGVREAAAFFAGLVVACAAILAFPLAGGSTLGGTWFSLVVYPSQNFAQSFSNPLQVRSISLVWMVVNLGLAVWWRMRGLPPWCIAGLKLLFAALVAGFTMTYQHNEVLGLGTPMLWLVMASPRSTGGMLRPLLALMGVLQVMYAYPVSGSQGQFVTVLFVVIAAICVHDTLPWIAERIPVSGQAAALVTMVAVAAMYAHDLRSARARFLSMEPLNLPGAHRLRIEPERAAAIRRVVEASRGCTMLVSEPGLYSLNLLSRRPAPSGLVAGAWMLFNDDASQRAVLAEIANQSRPCAVVDEAVARFWAGDRDVSGQPLVQTLHEWPLLFSAGEYEFRAR